MTVVFSDGMGSHLYAATNCSTDWPILVEAQVMYLALFQALSGYSPSRPPALRYPHFAFP